MPTEHTVPSTTRTPGNYHEFDLLSAARGITPTQARVLGIGMMAAAGSATADEPVQVFSNADADAKFGQGSEAALLARIALEVGKRKGISPEVWVIPIADPAGTAAIYHLTTTIGTAAAAGDIVFRICGRTLRASISKDDDEAASAIAIKAAIDAYQAKYGDLPVTATIIDDATDNIVALTAVNTGVNGNDIDVEVVDVGLTELIVTPTAPTPGVGVGDPTGALTASLAATYETLALMNHAAQDVTDLVAHMDEAWAPDSKRWRFGFIGETGTLATVSALAAGGNDERVHFIGCEDARSLPGELAMAEATAVALRARPNYNWDGDELPLYGPPESSVWDATEIESALASGVTPLVPNDERTQLKTVRLINSITTVSGAPAPEEIRDLAPLRGMVTVTRDLDAVVERQFGAQNKSERVRKAIKSVCYQRLKLWESRPLEVLQNVDTWFKSFSVDPDPGNPFRALIKNPLSVIPNLHQRLFLHTLIVE